MEMIDTETVLESCPCCNASEEYVDYGEIEIDGPHALQDCGCTVCGAEWDERYKFIGYTLKRAGE